MVDKAQAAGLIGQIADIDNLFRKDDEEALPSAPPALDPFEEVILSDPNIPPLVKAQIRSDHRRRLHEARLEQEILKLQSREKRRSQSIISSIPIGDVDVPLPGFQFGTAMGMTGAAALVVDIIADPLNFVSGIGALTKGGRAARALKGLSRAEKLDAIVDSARVAAHSLGDDVLFSEVQAAAKAQDGGKLLGLIRSFKEKAVPDDVLAGIARSGEHGEDFVRLVKGDKKAAGDILAAMEIPEAASPGLRLGASRMDQIRQGQRAIFQLSVPFKEPFAEFTGEGFRSIARASRATAKSVPIEHVADDVVRTVADVSDNATAREIGDLVSEMARVKGSGIRGFDGAPQTLAREVAEQGFDGLESFGKKVSSARASLGELKERISRQGDELVSSLTKDPETKAGIAKALSALTDVNPATVTRAIAKEFPQFRAMAKLPGGQELIEKAMALKTTERALGEATRFLDDTKGHEKTVEKIFETVTRASNLRAAISASDAKIERLGTRLNEFKHQLGSRGTRSGLPPKTRVALKKKIERESSDLAREQARRREISRQLDLTLGRFAKEIGIEKGAALKVAGSADLPAKLEGLAKDRFSKSLSRLRYSRGLFGNAEGSAAIKAAAEVRASLPAPQHAPLAASVPTPGLSGGPDTAEDIVEAMSQLGFASKVLDELSPFQNGFARRLAESEVPWGITIQTHAQVVDTTAVRLGDLIRRSLKFDETQLELFSRLKESPAKFKEWVGTLDSHAQTVINGVGDLLNKLLDSAIEAEAITDGIENYMPRLIVWKDRAGRKDLTEFAIAAGKKMSSGAKTLPGSRHGLHRVFESIEDLIGWAGKHPELVSKVELDAATLVENYYRSIGRAVMRNQMIRAMEAAPLMNGLPLVINERRPVSESLLLLFRNNQRFYSRPNNPVFKDIWFLKHGGIARSVNALFGRGFLDQLSETNTGFARAVGAVMEVSNALKGTLLAWSPFFHGLNLEYSNFALLQFPDAVRANKSLKDTLDLTFSTKPETLTRLSENVHKMWATSAREFPGSGPSKWFGGDLRREYDLTTGLGIGRVAVDTGFNSINKFADALSSTLPKRLQGIGQAARAINTWSDRNLWAVLKDGLSFNAWMHLRHRTIERMVKNGLDPWSSPELMFKINRDVGSEVAHAFGGTVDRLLIDKRFKESMRLFFLAPDWTLSNVRQAYDVLVNNRAFQAAFGNRASTDVLLKDERFKWALGYQLRFGFYVFTMANLLNYAFNGRFLWDNDEASRDKEVPWLKRVELPWKGPDGRRQFADLSKQIMEPVRWAYNPFGTFHAKTGPVPKIFSAAVVGVDSFGNKVYGAEDGPSVQTIKRIGETTSQFFPIIGQGIFDAATGKRSGLSSAASSLFGISVTTEPKDIANQRARVHRLEQELEALRQ